MTASPLSVNEEVDEGCGFFAAEASRRLIENRITFP